MKNKDMFGISLEEYPLSQKAFEKEIEATAHEELKVVFFSSTFPWSNEHIKHSSWTYPEQLFPRLSKMISQRKLNIAPGIIFPNDFSDIKERSDFNRMFRDLDTFQKPVWNIVEDSILDLMSLCDWGKDCYLNFTQNSFDRSLLNEKIMQVKKENGYRINIFDANCFKIKIPEVIALNNDIQRLKEEIETLIKHSWDLIRKTRETAFVTLKYPQQLLNAIRKNILLTEKLTMELMTVSENVIDKNWMNRVYMPQISALKEEQALLSTRFPSVEKM